MSALPDKPDLTHSGIRAYLLDGRARYENSPPHGWAEGRQDILDLTRRASYKTCYAGPIALTGLRHSLLGAELNPSAELVNKLWRLCAVLRKDGITYPQYVSELTYLLFLKMMKETGREEGLVPVGLRWIDLITCPPDRSLDHYRTMLSNLGDPSKGAHVAVIRIFGGATTVLRDPRNLQMLTDAIDRMAWFSEGEDRFGDIYEGLLQKNAEETKRGAGQYFTPRVIIDLIVEILKPSSGEIVQDPAAGTGGFLVSSVRAARRNGQDVKVSGMENVQDTYRLLLMNLYLHGIGDEEVHLGDTLSDDSRKLGRPDIILTNPPFGPAGGRPTRSDLAITGNVASYQLPFVEHCIDALSPGGRAAIVIPDNVLFEGGRALALRQKLMDRCELHTILRLPTGIFYAAGVRTNVLFFNKGTDAGPGTSETWIYDLRANMQAFGKTAPITDTDFADFVASYGSDRNGHAKRTDKGEDGRFRRFTRDEISARDDSLDISWLMDDSLGFEASLENPDDIALAILDHLRAAVQQIEALAEDVESSSARETV